MNDVREVLKKYDIIPLGYFKINDDVIKITNQRNVRYKVW